MSFFNKYLSLPCLFIILLAFSFSFNVAFASKHHKPNKGSLTFRDKTNSNKQLDVSCEINGGNVILRKSYSITIGGTSDRVEKDPLYKDDKGYCNCMFYVEDIVVSKLLDVKGCRFDAEGNLYIGKRISTIDVTNLTGDDKKGFTVSVSCQ